MLGAILAVLSAATFALNNAAARRGVITGTPIQGMAVTIPLGVVCFLPFALISGSIDGLPRFPPGAVASLAAVGLLHFLGGRYCNYRASQLAGVNLTAPVIQLQVVVTLTLAVTMLGEPCTLLQLAGAVVMVLGSLVTQGRSAGGKRPGAKFNPKQGAGFIFAALAALVYGTTPIMVRTALKDAGPWSGMVGGLIAYGAAAIAVVLALASSSLRRNIMALRRENLPWFAMSGVFVAAAQGFLYSALAVAPILLVAPLMQLGLVFRLIFALLLTREYEVFGVAVMLGTAVSLVGACAVSVDSNVILAGLSVPDSVAQVLRLRI
jgi:drug/metabolite transporter (DMT)-like permease